jgi:hypothetical protein
MARLGDVGALEAAERSLPPRAQGRVTSCLGLARQVADQVEASHAADPLAALAALPAETLDEVSDQGLIVAALARIEDRLSCGPSEADLALSIVLRSKLSPGVVLVLAARLAARERVSTVGGSPPDTPREDGFGRASSPGPSTELSFVETVLTHRTESISRDLDRAPYLAAAFGPLVSLHEPLATALRNLGDFAATCPAVEAALTRAGHPAAMDGLLAAWVSGLVANGSLRALAHLADEALFRRIVRLVIDRHGAIAAVALYQETSAPEHAAAILDELRRSPPSLMPELRGALRTTDTWMRVAHNAAAAGWLRECVGEPG